MKRLLFALVLGALALQANPGVIKLLETTIDPASPAFSSAGEEMVCTPDSEGRMTYLLQPAVNFSQKALKAVAAGGVSIVGVVPPNAYIASATPKAMAELKESFEIIYCGEYRPEYKALSSLRLAEKDGSGGKREMFVVLTGREAFAQVSEELEKLGAEKVEMIDIAPARLRCWFGNEAIAPLLKMSGVIRVEVAPDNRLFNGVAQGENMMNVTAVKDLGYNGKGQTVAIFDSGLDSGSIDNIHPDFAGKRITGTGKISFHDDYWADTIGHGTHVAGTILGSGSNDPKWAGVASEADVYACYCTDGKGGVSAPEKADLDAALNAGAYIMNNSWGSTDPTTFGMYVSSSAFLDNYMWENPEVLMVFAAGNNNTIFNPYNNCTISVQATAKNVLTVGAAECHKEEYRDLTYGGAFKFTDQRYKNDPLTWPNNGTDQGMAGFSSRGPAHDGRKKPDIAAPGTIITSCASIYDSSTQTRYGVRDKFYRNMNGTSQATPGVSGCAAVVREYLAKDGCEHPSGALVKAFLLNGARSMGKGQFSGYIEIPEETPNHVSGFGHVNLKDAIAPEGQKVFYVEGVLSNSGDTATYNFKKEKVGPVTVTLCWTDYPATPGSGSDLVNDLDLQVYDGFHYLYCDGTTIKCDSVNNCEKYSTDLFNSGDDLEIRIKADNIMQGPQPFAFVVRGMDEGPIPEPGLAALLIGALALLFRRK